MKETLEKGGGGGGILLVETEGLDSLSLVNLYLIDAASLFTGFPDFCLYLNTFIVFLFAKLFA